jgi:hypothetical protein
MNILLSIRLRAEELYNDVVTVSQVYDFNNFELACILGDANLVDRLDKKYNGRVTKYIKAYMNGGSPIVLLKRDANRVENGLEEEIW